MTRRPEPRARQRKSIRYQYLYLQVKKQKGREEGKKSEQTKLKQISIVRDRADSQEQFKLNSNLLGIGVVCMFVY